jgi:hypothetical protein
MQLIVDVAYWPKLCNNDMQHVAGFFCILKSHAHLTIHSTDILTPLPRIQRGSHWQQSATQPTINPTFGTGAGRDRRSLSCNGYCFGCSGGGSIGSEAADWGIRTRSNLGTNCGLTLAPLLNQVGGEYFLHFGGEHADVFVVLGDLDDFGSILCSRTLYLIFGLRSLVLPMNSSN